MPLSYVKGSDAVALKRKTIGAAFDDMSQRFAARDALIVAHQSIHWSYSELAQQVNQLAAGFVALGLNPGDRVGIWAPNCSEWTVTQFASAKAGLILVNINPAYRLSELEFCLNKVGCRALVSAARLRSSDYIEMLQTLLPELSSARGGSLQSARVPDLRWVIRLGDEPTLGCLSFPEVLRLGDDSHRRQLDLLQNQIEPDTAVNIQFTSGTTGSPKGATLSHTNILNNGFFVGEGIRLTEYDRVCIPVPLYHCFGMVMGNVAAITHGAAMIYPTETFDAAATLRVVARERATALYGVPTMFIAELESNDFASHDLSSLRTGIMAGAPCPIEVMKRVMDEMHMPDMTICYGMTETSPVSFQSAVNDPVERRVTTVGRVHPHLEARIVDQTGECPPSGTQGEIQIRGYSVMCGYWNDSEKTREVVDEAGWMQTGDLGVIDAAGYCQITGRLKDVVIRGGENIYPREIEEFFFSHPKVSAVHVCSIPDSKFGEELCAWIQLKASADATVDEMQEYCRGQIAHYKIPRYIRFVTDFPMTVTGKVQKFAMREQMKKELGIE